MKIAVMGYSGGDKSYLADILSQRLSIPVMHLDKIMYDKHWQPYKTEITLPQIAEFMARED